MNDEFLVDWGAGLSYEYRAVNLSKGEQFDPGMFKMNDLCSTKLKIFAELIQ